MKRVSLFICFLAFAAFVLAKYSIPQYDIVGAGSGTEGTCLVKVYVYSKSAKVADAAIKQAAIHGVIFKGFSGTASKVTEPPMAKSPSVESQFATFFDAFLDEDGSGLQYASIVNGSYERVKASKGYKVGAIVQVNKSKLRKELESAGVIKSLSSGF